MVGKKERMNIGPYFCEGYFSEWAEAQAWVLGVWSVCGDILKDNVLFYARDGTREVIENLFGGNDSFFDSRALDDLNEIFGEDMNTVPDIPEMFVRHYVRGVVDCAGSVGLSTRNYPNIILSRLREDFAEKLKELIANETGIEGALTKRTDANHQLMYYGIKAKCLAFYLYDESEIHSEVNYDAAADVMAWQGHKPREGAITEKMRELFGDLLEQAEVTSTGGRDSIYLDDIIAIPTTVDVDIGELQDMLVEDAPTPEELVASRIRMEWVLEQVAPQERDIIYMLANGWTYNEIMGELGCSYDAARKRTQRAREAMVEHLVSYDEQGEVW